MKKIKNVRSKKFEFYGYAPPLNTGYGDSSGDSVVMLQGQCQALGFKGIHTIFPEKIECAFVLNPVEVQTESTWVKTDTNDVQQDLGNVYAKITAYDRIEWGDPGAVRMMRQGVLYPLDASFSVGMPLKEIRFDVLPEDETGIQSQQEYPYGGLLLEENAGLDGITGCKVVWTDGAEDMQIVSKLSSVGEYVRSGAMALHVTCQNLQDSHIFSQNNEDGKIEDILPQKNPENSVEHVYVSYDYRMIDAVCMRVFFFPK